MPIYEYKPRLAQHCEYCNAGFELLQKINDPAVQSCPECEAPVERIISAPSLSRTDSLLSADNLNKHGFTQYKKSRKGMYRKSAGKGPDVITNE